MDELSIENVETTVLITPAYDSLIEKLDERKRVRIRLITAYLFMIKEKHQNSLNDQKMNFGLKA